MRVLVCSYIKTSRHPRRRGIRARARERTFTLSLAIPLSRGTRVRVRADKSPGSPTTACSLIFADYLKSKSFYLSERMELSNDPAVFQHYIRLTSPYRGPTSPRPLASTIDSRAADVLFAGALHVAVSPLRFRSFSPNARACYRAIDDGRRRERPSRNIFLFVIRTNCRKHFVLLRYLFFHIIYRGNETL